MQTELSPQSVRAAFKCDANDKKEFYKSSCSLTISVGQPYHEGNKFLATIDLVNKSFERCFINVCDTHQRHTIAVDNEISLSSATSLSRKLGTEWIHRNQVVYQKLVIQSEIIRWDDWLVNPDYQDCQSIIENLYKTDAFFEAKINAAANLYLQRYRKRTNKDEKHYALMYNASLEYLKEECAVMLLWRDAAYNFEIYPSERNIAMVATYELLIKPHQPKLLRPVSLILRTKPKYRCVE